jgi:hypothetical protein
MTVHFTGLPTAVVADIRTSGRDAYGNEIERRISDGDGVPCRHCLRQVPEGQAYLILAHRPFATKNPYAETGPIFLCAEDCAPAPSRPDTPEMLASSHYIVRGYCSDERIVYGTGKVVPTDDIAAEAGALLDRPGIAFVDVRSASNNCFQCRIFPA